MSMFIRHFLEDNLHVHEAFFFKGKRPCHESFPVENLSMFMRHFFFIEKSRKFMGHFSIEKSPCL